MTELRLPRLLVTGGAGYVGAVLVPHLLGLGHQIRVLDLYLFGEQALAGVRGHPRLEEVRGDLRDDILVKQALQGIDAVVHLACISNDPSCELDPQLTRSINLDAFVPLVREARAAGVRRFVFASSSSIYGLSDEPQVTEDHPMRPVSLYNQYKYRCEEILFEQQSGDFTTVAIRPATLCGRSPRQRLDLTVNLLTAHALERGAITVFGGAQQRPNLHLDDMVSIYELLLRVPDEVIAGEAFNAAYRNHSVSEIAAIVVRTVAAAFPERPPVTIETVASNDPRSYRVNCDKLRDRLGYQPQRSIEDGITDLIDAYRRGELALDDPRSSNVRWMKQLTPRVCAPFPKG
ncbi:MAG TPA: SDR family oxidoreductase, partial [Terriglobales bacterium]|nr:SDR family oxidoreductase [Terriglobales bacterium]